MPKQIFWLMLHTFTVRIPVFLLRLCKKRLLPYWLYILPDGIKIIGPLSPEVFTVIWEIYHRQSYEKISIVKHPNMVIIDCGAHIGLYSLKMARSGRRVISIEPENQNFQYLTLNIRLNKFVEKILPLKLAVSDKNGFTSLMKTKNSTTHSIVHADNYVETETVKTISLDTLIRKLKLDSVDILKLDVEGAELLVLKSLRNEAMKVKNIVLELHTNIVKIEDIVLELNLMNFVIVKVVKIPGMPNNIIVYATRVKP
jgi:FkbM family methyltransferase